MEGKRRLCSFALLLDKKHGERGRGGEVIKIHCKLLFRGEEDFSFSSSHLGRKVSGRHANIRVRSRPRCQKLCGIWCPLRGGDSDLLGLSLDGLTDGRTNRPRSEKEGRKERAKEVMPSLSWASDLGFLSHASVCAPTRTLLVIIPSRQSRLVSLLSTAQ